MGNIRHPRRGSLQFWPRKRAKSPIARIRSWPGEGKVKPVGFIGYKAGMTHCMAVDNRSKSMAKGEQVSLPATVVECPPLSVMGVVLYRHAQKVGVIMAEKLDKNLGRRIPLPKKEKKKEVPAFEDVHLLVSTIPRGGKMPRLMELALGGDPHEKLSYAQEVLGKQLKVTDVFESGMQVDVHGITKGKGFQGTVKRYGVPIRQHKAEKTKRGIGTLGSWTPKRVEYTVAQPGKMGYHLRTEYNKQILSIEHDGQKVTPPGGRIKYGLVTHPYLLIKGSVVGPRQRAITLLPARRPNPRFLKDSYQITAIAQRS